MFSFPDDEVKPILAEISKISSLNARPILIAIDGPAGSGKTSLANQLVSNLKSATTIHMDDLYPGWNGLAAGAEYLQRFILGPISQRTTAHWQLFDWAAGERADWREFAGGTPLIIEGCGAINRNSIESADLSVWLEESEETRKERWLGREGNDVHWAQWAAQELDFYARERSSELAGRVLGG